MKNKEKFAKEIIEVVIKGDHIAFDKINNKVVPCASIRCSDCLFQSEEGCPRTGETWANAEYKEKKEFSEADKAYVKAMDKLNWFAREKNGLVFGYVDKPFKNAGAWDVREEVLDEYAVETVSSYSSATFDPLSWDDEEPTSREEILRGSDE